MRPQLEAISLPVEQGNITGIRQHVPGNTELPRLLCIHGWLDNANSFLPMMPYLPSFDLVAIDLPGHGHSDPLSQVYTMHEMCYQLCIVLRALNWSSCHLLGHSLGGNIAPMLTVSQPDIVDSLIMIEASGPLSESADQLPERMQRAMNQRLEENPFQSRVFKNKDEAVSTRLRAAKMAPASARLIIDRQLQDVDDGYAWRFDPAWRIASSQYQTEEQVRAILRAVHCKTLTVLADEGYLADRPDTNARLDCLDNHTRVDLPGHHHLHMDTPEPVAAAINQFLEATPALGG